MNFYLRYILIVIKAIRLAGLKYYRKKLPLSRDSRTFNTIYLICFFYKKDKTIMTFFIYFYILYSCDNKMLYSERKCR